MRVKKLEVFGFKSFAQKTTIQFEPGVTAIVGPNGSGKSNIVDSIRWVLGEHNPRDVRAPRLEDVIFNGTDKRAPVSVAEVHLTISNEKGLLPIAFSEVTITRRVYRSGESECFINQAPCRLKDIHELFLGTGLGGGTYAIIEQGHIDMILSSKPEERRVVFEEASGVAKFLSKKRETMRRLEETEEHLVRIADIISEVRRQVSALERAANKARQYKTQWEQVKQYELRLAVDELCAGESRHQELEQKLQELTSQREGLETDKQRHVSSLEACNAAVSAVQQQVQQAHTKIVECTSQIEQHQSQSSLKERWIGELKAQAESLASEEAQLRARLSQVEEQLAHVGGGETEIRAQLTAVVEQLTHGGGELEQLEAAITAALQAVAGAKAQVFEAAADASHQRNQLAELTSRLQRLEAQLVRFDEQTMQRTAKADEVRQRREAAVLECSALQVQHDGIQQSLAAAQQSLDAAAARRHELTGRAHQLRDQLAGERARVKLLEDLWHRYEGFPDTVKQLMSRSIPGLIGPLVDLVQAVPGYEEVVEAALGPLSEALVVQDRSALSRCREALTTQELESCRFLVLSDCPSPSTADAAPAMAGTGEAVKRFVRAEASYQPLVDWLLDDSWIVEDLDRLLRDPSVPPNRVVNRRGDRWDRRSWRFGGARRPAHGRIGRKQRWEQAHSGLQSLEEEFTRLDSQAQQAEQAWQSVVREQESARGRLAQAAPSLQKIDALAASLSHEASRLEEEQQSHALDVQRLAGEREELRAAVLAAQQAAEQAAQRQQASERSLAEAQALREQSDLRKQELVIAKAQVDATRQSLADRLSALESRRAELSADRNQQRQQADSRASQRQDATRRSDELAQQLEGHRESAQHLQQQRAQLEADAERAAGALQEEEAKRGQVVPHLLAVEQQLSSLMQKVQEQQQQLSERGFRRSRLVERLRELYQIDEATIQTEVQAHPEPLNDEQRASMAEQVQKLRGKLEGLGPVSLGSVEEYDELKRRLEFLQTQQQDLIQARDDLKASITQINRAARTQFRETFERIKQEFQHYYARLFQGGEADLILLDEEDVLESGIDIVARPPGKRLQSISLLSGGERALTAVALLFALFKVRPSPFCILDEIDAPLDEANVDRFTRVLEEFLALSQFILITHNKKTITKADSLYGVTMEEPGVSKILSAKLTKTPAASAPVAAPA